MSVTTETGYTPILDTRIPEGRAVPGIEYGAHVSRPGWSGYYVRTGTWPQWGLARQTPASDELAGDDREVARAVAEELEALELVHAEAVAGAARGGSIASAGRRSSNTVARAWPSYENRNR